MVTTTGLPAALAARTALRICSEAVSDPPGEDSRKTIAFTPSSSIADWNARDTSSERIVSPPPRGFAVPEGPARNHYPGFAQSRGCPVNHLGRGFFGFRSPCARNQVSNNAGH